MDLVPPALAVVAGLAGIALSTPEISALCFGGGYVLGKFVQSVAWTVGGLSFAS